MAFDDIEALCKLTPEGRGAMPLPPADAAIEAIRRG